MTGSVTYPPTLRLSDNPTTWGVTPEFRLDSFPVGGIFRSATPYRTTTGEVVEVMAGCVMVRIHGKAQEHVIHAGEENEVRFTSKKSKYTYWAPETAVEYLGQSRSDNSNSDEETTMKTATKKSTKKSAASAPKTRKPSAPKTHKPAKSAPAPVAATEPPTATTTASVEMTPSQKAIVLRWGIAVKKLGDLLKIDTATAVMDEARDKLRELYAASVAEGVDLPQDAITYTDPVYAEFDLGAFAAQTPANGADVTGDAPVVTGRAIAKKAPATKSPRPPKTAKAAGKATAPRPKKAKELHACLDGCGEQVKGNFKQGHDARYRSLILKVEREEITESKLPALMRSKGGRDGQPLQFKKAANGFKCTNSVLAH